MRRETEWLFRLTQRAVTQKGVFCPPSTQTCDAAGHRRYRMGAWTLKDPWPREVINKASHPHCFGRRVGGTNIGEMMLDVKAVPVWCLWSS